MSKANRWTPEQLLLAFRLYCRTPFGKLHQKNPQIIELARQIGRTPSAVAMKACNFASLDPQHQMRGVSALGNVSRADRELWEQFTANPERVAAHAEALATSELSQPSGPTEIERYVRTRRVQSFFRASVFAAYGDKCAITGLAIRTLLNASHIIPWSVDEARRADPRNGLCLNALHDRAFDRGLITFDDDYRVVVAASIKTHRSQTDFHRMALLNIEGTKLRQPERFLPDPAALAHHRHEIFERGAA